jgi:hypothetical protein
MTESKISAEALPEVLMSGDRVFHIPSGLAVEVLRGNYGEGTYLVRFPRGGEFTISRALLGGVDTGKVKP